MIYEIFLKLVIIKQIRWKPDVDWNSSELYFSKLFRVAHFHYEIYIVFVWNFYLHEATVRNILNRGFELYY